MISFAAGTCRAIARNAREITCAWLKLGNTTDSDIPSVPIFPFVLILRRDRAPAARATARKARISRDNRCSVPHEQLVPAACVRTFRDLRVGIRVIDNSPGVIAAAVGEMSDALGGGRRDAGQNAESSDSQAKACNI
jgi:hypothetical protein